LLKLHEACRIPGSALSTIYKLKNAHLNPSTFEKMKVSMAAQVFSNTVANSLKYMRTICVDKMLEL